MVTTDTTLLAELSAATDRSGMFISKTLSFHDSVNPVSDRLDRMLPAQQGYDRCIAALTADVVAALP